MDTKNINYKKFNDKKKSVNKKKLINFLNTETLIQKYPLLKSLTKNYDYSFKKKYLLNLILKFPISFFFLFNAKDK